MKVERPPMDGIADSSVLQFVKEFIPVERQLRGLQTDRE
jgi:hypothetical protein